MKFGKVDVPDSWLWVIGLAIPIVSAAVYHHFRPDPADIVTDVRTGPGTSLLISYNTGPDDTIAIQLDASLWASQGPRAASLMKTALVGLTRDRIRASVQHIQQNQFVPLA